MCISDTRELVGVYRPSVRDKIIATLGVVWAFTLASAIFHVASASYGGVDRFDAGFIGCFCLFALIIAETHLHTVTVNQESISQRSPLGIYRQSLRHDHLSGFRLTYAGRGYIAEACFDGRWIVFCSNQTFRRRIKSWPNQTPETTRAMVRSVDQSRWPRGSA